MVGNQSGILPTDMVPPTPIPWYLALSFCVAGVAVGLALFALLYHIYMRCCQSGAAVQGSGAGNPSLWGRPNNQQPTQPTETTPLVITAGPSS